MPSEPKAEPTGTGQEGAGTPAGANRDIPVHIEGGAEVDKADRAAEHAARRGIERQHRDDPTIFTK